MRLGWEGNWNRDADGHEVKIVFELGLGGCIAVYCVEKGRKSIPGIENNMFKGMEASKHGVAGHESSQPNQGTTMKSPEKHVQDFGLYPLGMDLFSKVFMLEMEACRYMFQHHKPGMRQMVKKRDVSLKAGKPARSLLPSPVGEGSPNQGSSTGDSGEGKTESTRQSFKGRRSGKCEE